MVSMPSDSGITSSSSQSSPGGAVTGQQVGLDRGAQRHHLVRVDVRVRAGLEELGDRAAHVRHARRAADHHHAVDVVDRHVGVAHGLADGVHGLGDQVLRDLGEGLPR